MKKILMVLLVSCFLFGCSQEYSLPLRIETEKGIVGDYEILECINKETNVNVKGYGNEYNEVLSIRVESISDKSKSPDAELTDEQLEKKLNEDISNNVANEAAYVYVYNNEIHWIYILRKTIDPDKYINDLISNPETTYTCKLSYE
ncbi:hypothetical protein [Culicoidibacter larvae]|uniref:Uncharacterized protein n=1 Tax=Culicoidibacter larvae TaxID=2579976 RepID=A0A5R8QB56_9FIRM|nr:hypothetical protein [Culicoidibacter larvae]TLG72889.1 hypothetical protein FEZ08_07530 [Culicoidibacter larvae]